MLDLVSGEIGTRRYRGECHGFVETRRTDGDNEEAAPDILYVWAGRGGAR